MCLPAFSNQYRYHTTCAILPNRAFSGEAGIWGRDSRGSPTDPQLEQCRCNAKPDLRYRARAATIAFCQPAAGIATNESDLAHGKRRSGILCQALFRVDLQVVEHSTRNANTFHRENMFHRDGLAATIASKTNASRLLESRDARRTASRRGGVCWHPAWLGPIFQNCIKVTSH
jgi:hypothetical protein